MPAEDRDSFKDQHTTETLSLSQLSKDNDPEAHARSSTLAGMSLLSYRSAI